MAEPKFRMDYIKAIYDMLETPEFFRSKGTLFCIEKEIRKTIKYILQKETPFLFHWKLKKHK
jgi:hypothetical protein